MMRFRWGLIGKLIALSGFLCIASQFLLHYLNVGVRQDLLQPRDANRVAVRSILNKPSSNRWASAQLNLTENATTNSNSDQAKENNLIVTAAAAIQDAANKSDCEPITCRNGVCFENLLCHKLPPFLPNFKNPCFVEQVCITAIIQYLLAGTV